MDSFKQKILSILPFENKLISLSSLTQQQHCTLWASTKGLPSFETTLRPVGRTSRQEALRQYQRQQKQKDTFVFSITYTESVNRAVLAGRIGLYRYNPRNQSAEVGYYILPEHRGKGIGTAALKTICEIAFTQLYLNRLFAQTLVTNHASIQMLQTCGFLREGTLRSCHELHGALLDDVLYGLLRQEYLRPGE